LWLCLALLVVPVHAGEAPQFNQVSFEVTRSQQVDNDRVELVLVAEGQDGDPARLARRINEAMAWGLSQVQGEAGLEVGSGNYQTYPVRDRGEIKAWRASQELRVSATSLERLGPMLGSLQERLQIRSMAFTVSEDRRQAAEDELIQQALRGFQQRAEAVQNALGARSYRLVELRIQSGANIPGPVPMLRAQLAAAEADPVVMDAGTSRVQVTAAGTVQLEMK
jgi:predicted secreted protein